MKINEAKAMLAESTVAEAQKAFDASVEAFLAPQKQPANVMGLGVGVKWKNGNPTGEPALLVLVSQKVAKEQLRKADIVPPRLGGMQTDVLAIGYPMAGGGQLAGSNQTLAQRVRPAKGGYSVGHFRITAGTIATCVMIFCPEGVSVPPCVELAYPQNIIS